MKKYILLLFIVTLSLASCKKYMQDLNTNPEILPETKPEFLFTNATLNYTNSSRGHMTSMYGSPMKYMQYIVNMSGSTNGMYAIEGKANNPSPDYPFYSDYYSRGGNFRTVIKQIDLLEDGLKAQYQSLRAITLALEVHSIWLLMDMYGAGPWHEALKGKDEGITTPRYDYIEDEYVRFDSILKESSRVVRESVDQVALGANDYFYEGDYSKWHKFINSLRLKIAQRFEKRDPAHFDNVLADVVAIGSDAIISNNLESCIYSHPSDYNNNIDDLDQIRTSYFASYAFVDYLNRTGDPRLPLLVRPNEFDASIQDYKAITDSIALGVPVEPNLSAITGKDTLLDGRHFVGRPASPLAETDAVNYGHYINGGTSSGVEFIIHKNKPNETRLRIDVVSKIMGRLFVKNGGNSSNKSDENEIVVDGNTLKTRTPIITYSEMCFMMAELAANGKQTVDGSNAKTWLDRGIIASGQYYLALAREALVPGVETVSSTLTADLTTFASKFSGTREEIFSQAWVHLLKQPWEAYAMWKRTGYPQFKDIFQQTFTDNVAYLEEIKANGSSDLLVIPRRCNLPSSDFNFTEWEKARQHLLGLPDYTTSSTFDDGAGRIWWDVK